jgi:carbon-monoxide dehydrogenase medium subunit
VQVRNRGTIGGNVCLNLPTNHFPPVLVAVGAELTVAGREGERSVAADDFFEAPFTTAVRHDEVLTSVRIPPRDPQGQGDAFVAMSAGRESQSIVHVAASVRLDGATIAEARIAVGCAGPQPVRALTVEARLAGAIADEQTVSASVHGLGETLAPVSDVNATAEFKRHVAEVLVERSILAAVERAR